MEFQNAGNQSQNDHGEPDEPLMSPDLVLDLSLSNKASDQAPKREATSIHCFEAHSPPNDGALQDNETEVRVFSCNYCQRKFYSSQALGGHQNAHKRERTLAKRGQRIGSATTANLGYPYLHLNHYSSMASLPLHGSYFSRSLGIQVHSIPKSPFFSSNSGSSHVFGHNGWFGQSIDRKPAVGWPARTNPSGRAALVSSSDSARLDGIQNSSSTSKGIDELWSNVGHLKSKPDEMKQIDLSLKL